MKLQQTFCAPIPALTSEISLVHLKFKSVTCRSEQRGGVQWKEYFRANPLVLDKAWVAYLWPRQFSWHSWHTWRGVGRRFMGLAKAALWSCLPLSHWVASWFGDLSFVSRVARVLVHARLCMLPPPPPELSSPYNGGIIQSWGWPVDWGRGRLVFRACQGKSGYHSTASLA